MKRVEIVVAMLVNGRPLWRKSRQVRSALAEKRGERTYAKAVTAAAKAIADAKT